MVFARASVLFKLYYNSNLNYNFFKQIDLRKYFQMMEPKQIYRQGSKDNMQNHKLAKAHKTTSVPSTDKAKKGGNFSDKPFKEYDEPLPLVDGPSTPNTNKDLMRKQELNLIQVINNGHQGSQDSSTVDQHPDNLGHAQALTQGSAQRHLSNKSDTNLSQNQSHIGHQSVINTNGNQNLVKFEKVRKEKSETQKKRKLSEKQQQTQRRASNNRRGDQREAANGGVGDFDRGSQGTLSGQGKHGSKGNAKWVANAHAHTQDGSKPQFVSSTLFDQNSLGPQSFNPFANGFNPAQANGQNMGPNMANQAFPFNSAGNGAFMGGGQQAPQVHFIARKQQFIAQIAPEQLMGGDKRPFTATSLNSMNNNAKRPGGPYGNSSGVGGKQNGAGAYNFANAAFTNQAAVYLGALGARTHTSGFNFQPSNQANVKFSPSVYGEDGKGKVGARDLTKGMGASNGFGSQYSSDPYNSVMSSSLPATLSHSTKPLKGKAGQNRLQGKEKEQLYDETIKMKMLNNQLREEHVKLKTKIKILENELGRKEKTIEDLFNHNQLIQQAQSKHQSNSNQNLMPLAQTAQKYQQETFLVMSLKKQIRELKFEVVKRDEELEVLRKNIRNTRTQEFEQELQTYHDECLRLRTVVEELLQQGAAHPLHKQAMLERVQELEAQLAQKDMMLAQLSEGRVSHANMPADPDLAATSLPTPGAPGVKASESQQFDSHASEVGAVSGSASAQTHAQRDKSAERKQTTAPPIGAVSKDLQRELQRARKTLREKDKELLKIKSEASTLKKEQVEKTKSGQAQSKDAEAQVKTLKDRILLQKGEARRREDKLTEAEARLRRLEDTVQSQGDSLKQTEEANKSLKAQLRQAKHKHKAAEATAPTQPSEPAPQELALQTGSSKGLTPVPIFDQVTPVEKSPEKATAQPPFGTFPQEELALITLIGQREKLCRDDLTAMMLSGEESLRMLIKQPSDQLVEFVKANLHEEDALLASIPRYEIPKADFERQVLREMRIVLRDNAEKIAAKTQEELLPWSELEEMYRTLENFDYPHKDKLLEFIKYFFLDHIASKDKLLINFQAFKEHVLAKRPGRGSPEKTRNASHLRSGRKSAESSVSRERENTSADRRKALGTHGSDYEDERAQDEERMLDIAEQCFMRIADLLHMSQKTVRQVFLRYSQPEMFKDGSVLELLSPRGFLEGVRDIGFDDVTELEAACLMKVLAKPELDNSIILNEFVLIMENFGIPVLSEEDEYENDYIPDSESEAKESAEPEPVVVHVFGSKQEPAGDEVKEGEYSNQEEGEKANKEVERHKKFAEKAKGHNKHLINLKFEMLDDKGHKILKKLARFLLERYMHPREFFGPTIKKEVFGKNKCKVEVIKLHDFYLRIKLASIRKKLKEDVSLNSFLAVDGDKHPGFVQVRRMIKALEVVAEKEQELIAKEQEEKLGDHKDELRKLAEEREAQGLPTLTEEELEKLMSPPKEEKKQEEGKPKDYLEKKPTKGGLEEVLRLGGKGSKGEREGKSRFASVHGPAAQLNTIEEDLQETQTSHYSYQVKEGDHSDREGSRHQISTQLRNSQAQNELEDSGQRSNGGRGALPLGQSVQSGDYSGGSMSSQKKRNTKDIDSNDIQIADFKDFRKKRSADPKLQSQERPLKAVSDMRKYSIKEELNEDDQHPVTAVPGPQPEARSSLLNNRHRSQQHSHKASKASKLQVEDSDYSDKDQDNEYDMDGDGEEVEQRMKDELEREVNKKIEQQMQGAALSQDASKESLSHEHPKDEEDNTYDVGDESPERSRDALQEETVRTEKINEALQHEEDQADSQDRYSDDVDDEASRPSSPREQPRPEAESLHEQIGTEKTTDKRAQPGKYNEKPDGSEIEEDYEF